jgi:asparagine synthase (glutamine-hydrolysing)
MCGFFAVFQDAPIVNCAGAKRALETLAARGPDASGEWCERGVFLGHRRLSIIDLDTGDQPMSSHDGRFMIVFNGEIYNFVELRTRLVAGGARFQTRSDTEVILEAYRRWGSDGVLELRGMFAFVIWDRRERTVFGARDRLGIKPLCWATRDAALVVGSTLDCFAALGGFDRLDPIAVRDVLAFDYVPAPRTIFDGVHKLEPGSMFHWAVGERSPRIVRYWIPPLADHRAEAPGEEDLESLLDNAVRSQMISDVPIGAFLSGGIDSSLLVAFMSRHSSRPVRTFSVSFAEEEYDESPIAKRVSDRFGTDHTVIETESVTPNGLLDLLGRLDEPFCDTALIPTFLLSAMTKRHVKVALSGDGADEVFGGYTKYLGDQQGSRSRLLFRALDRSLRAVSWRPRGMGRLYESLLTPEERLRFSFTRHGDFPVFRKDLRQLLSARYRDAAEVGDYFQPWERRARRYGPGIDVEALMKTDMETYLSENCLVKTDRASMLASLEVRVPFLDETVLDRILPLPAKVKLAQGNLKALLQPLARRLLPREVWDRPKHGFNVPIGPRLAAEWRPAVETALDWGESNLRIFDYSYLRRLHAINLSSGGVGEIWNPFVMIAWSMARSVSA